MNKIFFLFLIIVSSCVQSKEYIERKNSMAWYHGAINLTDAKPHLLVISNKDDGMISFILNFLPEGKSNSCEEYRLSEFNGQLTFHGSDNVAFSLSISPDDNGIIATPHWKSNYHIRPKEENFSYCSVNLQRAKKSFEHEVAEIFFESTGEIISNQYENISLKGDGKLEPGRWSGRWDGKS